jgi:steroid 5-alpha reductase family enzyme
MGWEYLGILLIVCAVLCAVGFYKFVYFLSIGYGFAIAGGGITVLILTLVNGWGSGVLWLAILQAMLFLAYGIRLSGFLLYREIKNASYRKTLKEATGNDKKMPVFVLVTIWIVVAVLYTAQVSPMLYRYMNGATDVVVPLVGMVISVFGLILEATADRQKSAQKKANPDMVATEGLFRLVRCPNYLGEILFWTGVLVSGLTAYEGFGQWLMAILAYLCIVYIMFNGAQRLEKRQMARYGSQSAYTDYANRTPIILPFIPLYHLNKPAKEENTK